MGGKKHLSEVFLERRKFVSQGHYLSDGPEWLLRCYGGWSAILQAVFCGDHLSQAKLVEKPSWTVSLETVSWVVTMGQNPPEILWELSLPVCWLLCCATPCMPWDTNTSGPAQQGQAWHLHQHSARVKGLGHRTVSSKLIETGVSHVILNNRANIFPRRGRRSPGCSHSALGLCQALHTLSTQRNVPSKEKGNGRKEKR